MAAEDHRSGADADVHTILQRFQEAAGQAVAGDAAREVVVAAAQPRGPVYGGSG
jgi:hypothetical protein